MSILDLPGDILIVPQATLGGKLKGKVMQYHNNINKDIGKTLYIKFVECIENAVNGSAKAVELNCKVHKGTYGNLQVLNMNTNGPYTHTIEL